ncbi:MAG: hypothetical protein LBR48_04265 [Dysgonamonadaceae bacterium]|jgi:hypothetical protein|nr:hypothetical protein [Dysgonamonadaceae bacterium]
MNVLEEKKTDKQDGKLFYETPSIEVVYVETEGCIVASIQTAVYPEIEDEIDGGNVDNDIIIGL